MEIKMTDNEIIKALKNEIKQANYIESYYIDCVDIGIFQNALDLINRQKAEIERLKDELHRAKVEISKFYEQADAYCNEAIDVFADSMKIKLNRMIDNLVKEMT